MTEAIDDFNVALQETPMTDNRLQELTAEPEVKQVTWCRGDVAVAKMSTQDGLTEGKEYVVLAVNGEGDTVQIMDNDGRTNFRMTHYFTRFTAEPDKYVATVSCQCKPYKRYICPNHRATLKETS